MPASSRARTMRGTASSKPYERSSLTASPAQSTNPLAHSHLSGGPPVVQDPGEGDAENVPPDRPGLPTYADYKRIEAEYLHSLSPRKRDKALITQAMFDKIWDVLHQPEACTIETPQFRFWVRKMFSLSRPVWVGLQHDGAWGDVRACGAGMGAYSGLGSDVDADSDADEPDAELDRTTTDPSSTALLTAVVLHEDRPVAIMEQLYALFCYCHVRAGHGGRDKTCAVIRQHYSWVPKELTAQFVKACPTCALKRSGHGAGFGGVGMGVGVLVQRRTIGQRERGRRDRRSRGTPSGEDVSVGAAPSSLGWPATGGPLDPRNAELEQERERAWLCARGDAVDPTDHPADNSSGTRSLESLLWHDGAPRTDMPPFRPTNKPCWDEKRSATTNPAGLPSLASALSDDSLDENVSLTDPRRLGRDTAGECLPPVLRPLRLSGPVPSETTASDAVSLPLLLPFATQAATSLPEWIDPVLLSFDHPAVPTVLPETESGADATEALPRRQRRRHRTCGSRPYGCRDGDLQGMRYTAHSDTETGQDGPLSLAVI